MERSTRREKEPRVSPMGETHTASRRGQHCEGRDRCCSAAGIAAGDTVCPSQLVTHGRHEWMRHTASHAACSSPCVLLSMSGLCCCTHSAMRYTCFTHGAAVSFMAVFFHSGGHCACNALAVRISFVVPRLTRRAPDNGFAQVLRLHATSNEIPTVLLWHSMRAPVRVGWGDGGKGSRGEGLALGEARERVDEPARAALTSCQTQGHK
jgi:hypothetical protein